MVAGRMLDRRLTAPSRILFARSLRARRDQLRASPRDPQCILNARERASSTLWTYWGAWVHHDLLKALQKRVFDEYLLAETEDVSSHVSLLEMQYKLPDAKLFSSNLTTVVIVFLKTASSLFKLACEIKISSPSTTITSKDRIKRSRLIYTHEWIGLHDWCAVLSIQNAKWANYYANEFSARCVWWWVSGRSPELIATGAKRPNGQNSGLRR